MRESGGEVRHEYRNDKLCFLQLQLGGDRNFCYLLGDVRSGVAAAVDPGFNANGFADAAIMRNLAIRKILITHAHSDHVAQAKRLAELTGASLYAGERENVHGASSLRDGESLPLGERAVVALHTPGHSPGHLCLLFEKRLMTGDLLFCGKVGGTGPYFPGSSSTEEWESLRRIMSLPDEVLVFPGHDYYGGEGMMSHSTIGHERQHNPFLLCENLEAFLHLKANWDSYKREHGIR